MPNKAVFQDDSMQRLFDGLTAITDDANYLRNGINGFVNQLDGQLLAQISGQTSAAQALISQLTTRAEDMAGFIKFAIGQLQEAELKNKAAVTALTKVSVKENFWDKLVHGAGAKLGAVEKKIASGLHNIATTLTDTNPIWLILAPIPTLLVAVAKSFKVKIKESTFEARLGTLKEDNQVKYLLKLTANGTEGEQKWAMGQIEQIIKALDEIGRCQAAHAMYTKFGNRPYKDRAHQEAIKVREKLAKLNVASVYYEEGNDFSARYKGSPLLACHYNPMKSDHSELPADNQLRYLIETSALKDGMGKWAKGQIGQIEALYAIIGNAQKALHFIGDKSGKAKEESKITEARNKLVKDFHLDAKFIDGVDFTKYDMQPNVGGVQNIKNTNTIKSTGNYDKFLELLANHESSGNKNPYSVVNQIGYLGKYQMGEAALEEAGLYIKDISSKKNDYIGKWTDKAKKLGVTDKNSFLNNPEAQEIAIKDFQKKVWEYVKKFSPYIGTEIDGVTVTASGLLAAGHLLGSGGLIQLFGGKKYFDEDVNGIPVDDNGTPITKYMKDMGGIDLTDLLGYNPDSGKLDNNAATKPINTEIDNDIKGGKVPLLKQGDIASTYTGDDKSDISFLKSFAHYACYVTSITAVVNSEGMKISPGDFALICKIERNPGDTQFDLQKLPDGVHSQTIAFNEVELRKLLEEGKKPIIRFGTGTNTHFVVATRVDGNGDVIVMDPAVGKERKMDEAHKLGVKATQIRVITVDN
ncbi:hypothetical protein EHS13_30065 [Paenibacillus psychroresistens]|uniref:Peptidase C39 domain-containing protein n=1 Tax=Paenibacillus psychroresistens TaxID=1778678 RepID=A0A6B8RTP3_9BACL|nr:cysteine peptidase family C39 domain-containing protein [Paenibacillus psychroresistens]QGQ98823.1 hypothetical protein EHS13_30065 [Paenibacillus psychroresistens]